MPEKDTLAIDAIADILRTEDDVNGGDFVELVTSIIAGTGRDLTPPITYAVSVFGPNLSREGQQIAQFHVHAQGCGDCRHYGRGKRMGGEDNGWHLIVHALADVVEATYPPDEHDWDPANPADLANVSQEFWFAPCTDKFPFKEKS